jgi:hypothetical protein
VGRTLLSDAFDFPLAEANFCHSSINGNNNLGDPYTACFVARDATYSRLSEGEVITFISCQS